MKLPKVRPATSQMICLLVSHTIRSRVTSRFGFQSDRESSISSADFCQLLPGRLSLLVKTTLPGAPTKKGKPLRLFGCPSQTHLLHLCIKLSVCLTETKETVLVWTWVSAHPGL